MEYSTQSMISQVAAMENGGMKGMSKEVRHGKTAHNMSSSSLRKKSDIRLISKVRWGLLKSVLANLQEVILGTKLAILFPSIPLAIFAHYYDFGMAWVFGLSLLALTPLAERVSFLTEQIAYYTGPTVGGLLNATCGNVTELIIAVLALSQNKIDVVKYSLLGSILSNLLLVLGTSLLCGGLANLHKEQKFDRKQADVNCFLLLLGLFCHILPLLFKMAAKNGEITSLPTLSLSRAGSIVMLVAYVAYLVFQLWTHRQLFEAKEDSDDDDMVEEEVPVIGFWSGFVWLAGMTVVIALLSEYIVGSIEAASDSWGLSVSFISIILLPIVGNAAEHAGAIIFAFKNKLDISLGVALGSATQISMFVPLCVIVAWIMRVPMDLDFNTLETGCLALSIILTAFTLQLLQHPLALVAFLPKDAALFAAGAIAGAAAKTVTAPLDRIKLLMQTHGVRVGQESAKKAIGFFEAITMVGKEEGFKGYWKGNLPQVIRIIPYSAVQLCSYEVYKKLFRGEDGELTVLARLAAGACAGMTSTLVTYPLDVLRLRLAVEPGCRTMSQVALSMLKEEGIASFYNGLAPSLISIAPYIAVNFCIFDLVKKSLPEKFQKRPETSLVTALASATLATLMCYPLDTVRRQMQMRGSPYNTVLDAIPGIVARDGLIGLYRDFVPNALKNLPNSSIRLTTFDTVKSLIAASEKEYQRILEENRELAKTSDSAN